MVTWRSLLASLCFLTALSGAETPTNANSLPVLTVDQVISKARAAIAKEPAFLERMKGLHLEASAVSIEGKKAGTTILQLIAPCKRRQITYNGDHTSEEIVCCNGLEGWIKQTLLSKNQSRLSIMRFEVVRSVRDMAENDLTVYTAPAPEVGTVTYEGIQEIKGRPTYALKYTYKSGFNLTRYFDAQTFLAAGADQVTPEGKVQRQQIDEITWVDGLAFTKKESIIVDGKKILDVTYDNIIVNPTVEASSFAFPDR